MAVNDTYFVVCPVYNKKVTLNVGFNKQKSSPKDISFDYKYIGTSCDFTKEGKSCPYVDCPLVKKLDLQHSLRQ